jgi:archaellum component FlaC
LTVEGSDDVGYEAEPQGSSDEEATNGRTDHAETGSRVAAVLNAAEEAAETIKDEARRHADEVLRQANADAASRVEDLTRDSERVRTEADAYARDIRAAVDSYGTQARREADEEARKLLSDAEEQARATREAAQEMANQIEEDVRRRHESLAREAKSLEERRQRVLDGLRDLAAQLQDALVEPTSRDMDQSLADALDVERRR